MLRRYAGAGGIDAMLAEAEGGWGAVTGHGGSSVSSTAERRRSLPFRRWPAPVARREAVDTVRYPTAARYRVVPERSAVLIEARSSVGPITFGALGVTGAIDAEIHDGGRSPTAPTARSTGRTDSLRSGNRLYDAETAPRSTPADTPSSRSTSGRAEWLGEPFPGVRRRHPARRQPRLEGTVMVTGRRASSA